MNRVVVTGIGPIGAHGIGSASLKDALLRGEPLGGVESVPTLRGRERSMRIARVMPFERGEYLSPRKLRRMGEVSRLWVIACLLARREAALGEEYSPERQGTYLGTGFGCIDTTWGYLEGLFKDGPGLANPFLFSESVANAPAGHSALELDTRGPNVTFTCADASAATAVAMAARSIRDGRVEMAFCGGVELLTPALLRVLAALGAPDPLGEGSVCFILESRDQAKRRDAPILAEVTGVGMASDPRAQATRWSDRREPHRASIDAAMKDLSRSGVEAPPIDAVYLHGCGVATAHAAERSAVAESIDGADMKETTSMMGLFAAAGAYPIAAAIQALGASDRSRSILVNASSWGGSVVSLALSSP